ncbi:metallophosphoesterase family protein [Chitinophaga flava]|uniref:Metallophosphoesterase n=1 Tax=Chitinophaga flava TaxID=2259036 RepID=A0A365XZJ6_9BACT|nr:metallophosphoesterase [Chitinophaga flava]RBL91799.1 metallophosphoesterase [Chitinophaga flava]
MQEEKRTVRIAALADLHITSTDKGTWTDCFKEINTSADILLLCGDLTDTGDESEAEILYNELKTFSIPVVGVLGNHDYEKGRQKIIRNIIQGHNNVHILDGEAVVLHDIGFAGVKGFGGGFNGHMLSMFGENAMKAFVQESVDEALHLDRALAKIEKEHPGMKKIAVLHYSPVAETIAGESEQIYPFLGSSRLAEPLIRRKVTAAFHGHAHQGKLQGMLEEVKIFNVARPILLKEGLPKPFFIFDV